ncbi:GGDEF domain-containing protein [Solicola sp. PLA-1-18]|uniref:GGDEF domain-containing protein n=1 Tax=Solicola sp. PLA-1-18 TaxID=3380532 RepID=UPI003B7B4FD2
MDEPEQRRWQPRDDEPGSSTGVDLDVVRRLALVSSRMSTGSVLSETLQVVSDGIVEVLGFGVAAVNHVLPSGDFQVVALTGPPELREELADAVTPRADMVRALDRAVHWGRLRFSPHETFDEDEPAQWVPDVPVRDDPDAWHPLDMLLAPMWDEDGEMVGVLSVDLPPGQLQPTRLLCELLEIFAMQAGLAVGAVEMRERYLEERSNRERLLVGMTRRDALTGLGNRRALAAALAGAVDGARRTGRPGAVLFADLDGLKQLNDERGHVAGDEALKAWAAAVVAVVREDDLVCRVGGDEYVVVAGAISEPETVQMADRLRRIADQDDPALGGLTLSVGCAAVTGDAAPEDILERADRAMYEDKSRRARARA